MVYFIQDSQTNAIKIGFTDSSDPNARISSLQTGNSGELVLLHAIEFAGREAETKLHKKFAAHRIAGEWFRPHPDLILYIVRRLEGNAENWRKLAYELTEERFNEEWSNVYGRGFSDGRNYGLNVDREEERRCSPKCDICRGQVWVDTGANEGSGEVCPNSELRK